MDRFQYPLQQTRRRRSHSKAAAAAAATMTTDNNVCHTRRSVLRPSLRVRPIIRRRRGKAKVCLGRSPDRRLSGWTAEIIFPISVTSGSLHDDDDDDDKGRSARLLPPPHSLPLFRVEGSRGGNEVKKAGLAQVGAPPPPKAFSLSLSLSPSL